MAIKVNGTTVINDSKQLQNVASLDSTTIATIGANVSSGFDDNNSTFPSSAGTFAQYENNNRYAQNSVGKIMTDAIPTGLIVFEKSFGNTDQMVYMKGTLVAQSGSSEGHGGFANMWMDHGSSSWRQIKGFIYNSYGDPSGTKVFDLGVQFVPANKKIYVLAGTGVSGRAGIYFAANSISLDYYTMPVT